MVTITLSFFFIIQRTQELPFFTHKLMQNSSNQKSAELLLQSRLSTVYTFASAYKIQLI